MDIELAILFTDVVDSTRLYELLGDLRARDQIRHCIDVMRGAIGEHRGTLINTMGDGVMASFTSPADAAAAAAQMQQAIDSHRQLAVDGQPMAVRIGFHTGAVVLNDRTKDPNVKDSDVHGTTVNIAARVMSEAKSGQILTTAATAQGLPVEWSAACRPIGFVELRGVASPVELMEVLWRRDDVTSMVRTLDSRLLSGRSQLRLWRGGEEFVIDEHKRVVRIGRDEQNDCVVHGQQISRWHARIEIDRNKFVLTDKSTNGTFVQMVDGKEDFVWRDSVPLDGEGMIGLGRLPEQDSPQTIRFICEERIDITGATL